ncbi:MAG TPA: oligosaccharide flippase family protein [Gemmatimonadales bacterium]|jgi:O-antigen/teichoic acid export membrane protein
MVGSTALGQLAIVATLPIIARLYHPEDLGRLGTFTAFLGTASVATALRYDILIVAAGSELEAIALLAGVCAMTIPVALLCCGILGWLIHQGLLGFGVLPPDAVLWMFPGLVATQLFLTLRYWLMRRQEFPTIARVTLGQSVVRAIAPLALYPLGGWTPLVASEVAGRCAGMGTMLKARGKELRLALAGLPAGAVTRALRNHQESPLAGLPSTLINTASNYLPLPLIAGAYGAAAAGYFAVVQRAMQLPLSLVGRNVADVFHARLAHHARVASGDARRLFWRTSLLLLGLGMIPGAVVLLAGRPAIIALLGREWAVSGDLLVALVPWSVAMFVVSPLSRAVVVFRGQTLKLVYDLISLVAVFVVMGMATSRDWSLTRLVWILSWSQAATYIVYFVVLLRLLPANAGATPVAVPPLDGD